MDARTTIGGRRRGASGLRTWAVPELRLVNVPDPDAAKRLRFLGSPTVRIDGRDVEPGAGHRDDFVLACRVFRTGKAHTDEHDHGYGHSHGLVDRSILRSRAGIKAVSISLAVLTVTAAAQTAIYVMVLSVALLADLIHNFGDALTAIPLGLAFFFRSGRGERWAGLAVVLTIFASAVIALVQTILRFIHPHTLTHLWWLAAAGVIGFVGNEIAARV